MVKVRNSLEMGHFIPGKQGRWRFRKTGTKYIPKYLVYDETKKTFKLPIRGIKSFRAEKLSGNGFFKDITI